MKDDIAQETRFSSLKKALGPLFDGQFRSLHPYEASYGLEGLGVLGLEPVAITNPSSFYALYPIPSAPSSEWPLMKGREVLGGDLLRVGASISALPLAWLRDLRLEYGPEFPEALEDLATDAESLAEWGEALGDGGAARRFVEDLPAERPVDEGLIRDANFRHAEPVTRRYWALTERGPSGFDAAAVEAYVAELCAIHSTAPSYGPPLFEALQWLMETAGLEDRALECAVEVLRQDLAVNAVGLLDELEAGRGHEWIVARAGAFATRRSPRLDDPLLSRLAAGAAEGNLETMHAAYLQLAGAEPDPFRAYVLARNAAFLFVMGTSSVPHDAWSEALRHAREVGDPDFEAAVTRIG